MGGLLTHLFVALIGCLIVSLSFKNYKWGLAFAIGQLMPDCIRFGFTGLFNGTLIFAEIVTKPLFTTLRFTHFYYIWVLVFIAIFVLLFVLYKNEKITKRKFKEWIIADGIMLLGAIVHLIIDALILEKSFWV